MRQSRYRIRREPSGRWVIYVRSVALPEGWSSVISRPTWQEAVDLISEAESLRRRAHIDWGASA